MTFEEWEQTVPGAITTDVLWKMRVYRLGPFASDIGWEDVTKLMLDPRTLKLSDQLYRALGSISANIAGGYSRSSARIALVSTNTRWGPRVKAVIGTTNLAMSSPMRPSSIALIYARRSSACG